MKFSDQHGGAQTSRDAQDGATEVRSLLEALRTLQEGRDALSQEMRKLMGLAQALQMMSKEMESSAAGSNIPALNGLARRADALRTAVEGEFSEALMQLQSHNRTSQLLMPVTPATHSAHQASRNGAGEQLEPASSSINLK